MGKIFVSYRREDIRFVQSLVSFINQYLIGGIDEVFYDKFVEQKEGAQWDTIIYNELSACNVCLVIVTPSTFDRFRIFKDNDWIRKELRFALEQNKPIIPIAKDRHPLPEMKKLPPDIRGILNYQTIPVYDDNDEYYLRAAGARIVERCRKIAPRAFEYLSAEQLDHFESQLRSSVNFSASVLVDKLISDINDVPEQYREMIGYKAWTTAEGLIAILSRYDKIAFPATEYNPSLLAEIAYKLINIDEHIKGGGIPAYPDLEISHRGVVDSTAIVLNALCTLRLFMYEMKLAQLSVGSSIHVSIEDISKCIDRLEHWLIANQNEDKGWGIWKGEVSRVTATAYAIRALVGAGVERGAHSLRSSYFWLEQARKKDGMWAVDWHTDESDLTSTAFAVTALAILSDSVIEETIQSAVDKLLNTTDWKDAVHNIEIEDDQGKRRIIKLPYASKPRVIQTLIIAGVPLKDVRIIKALQGFIDSQLRRGGWAPSQDQSSRDMNIWYTYVVVECIYTWLVYANKIPTTMYLSQVERALLGYLQLF